jgi:hypothetical protein
MSDSFTVPVPIAQPAEPILDSFDDWLAENAAPPKTVGVQKCTVVPVGTTVAVPEGLVLECADGPIGLPSPADDADGEHELIAGGGETVNVRLEVGRAYDLRFRAADGQVGPSTRISAHGDPELCQWWLCAVPRSVGHAALQASVSIVRALEAGERMLRCDVLLPGLNSRIETACGLDERLLQLLSFEIARAFVNAEQSAMLLFDSAGSAAAAQAAWTQLYGRPPPASLAFRGLTNKPVTRDEVRGLNTIGGGTERRAPWDFSPAVSPDDPRDAYICVRPRNSRGDAVVLALMQAHAKMPDSAWVLINPELEDTALRSTFGIRETDKYMAFLKRFAQFYLARGMYLVRRPAMNVQERGHLGMRYAESWDALKRTKDGFALLAQFDAQPTSNEIDALRW